MAAPNPLRQQQARTRLAELFAYPAAVFVVHYSCQSFFQGEKLGSPRVTAIGVSNLQSGQTFSYSVQQIADMRRLTPMRVLGSMDAIERELLAGFFTFLRMNANARFLHWNMRDATFGFAAIEHRVRVLGGEPFVLHEASKYDLARLLIDIFGTDYIENPKLENLARLNALSLSGYLDGAAEAEAFEHGRYQAVLQSNLRKVGLIAAYATMAHDRTLRTEASWWTRHGGRVGEVTRQLWNYPVLRLGFSVVGALSFGLSVLRLLGVI